MPNHLLNTLCRLVLKLHSVAAASQDLSANQLQSDKQRPMDAVLGVFRVSQKRLL
jgi:hypothetical protein